MPLDSIPNSKPCPICGVMFDRRDNETPSQFALRKTCSPVCSHRLKALIKLIPVEPKTCEVCGVTMTMRPHERKTAAFRQRRTCSWSCAGALRARGRSPESYARDPLDLGVRECVICSTVFERRSGEKAMDFRKRETCSKACGNTLSGQRIRKPDPDRFCEICGVKLERYATEKPRQFLVRTTCGGSCRAKRSWLTRFETTAFAPRLYTLDFRLIRERIWERDGWQCQECGVLLDRGQAHAHHINYDKKDNDDRNLITLCRPCHTRTNFRRDEWQRRFEALMIQRFGEAA